MKWRSNIWRMWAYFSTSNVHGILCLQFIVFHKEHDFGVFYDLEKNYQLVFFIVPPLSLHIYIFNLKVIEKRGEGYFSVSFPKGHSRHVSSSLKAEARNSVLIFLMSIHSSICAIFYCLSRHISWMGNRVTGTLSCALIGKAGMTSSDVFPWHNASACHPLHFRTMILQLEYTLEIRGRLVKRDYQGLPQILCFSLSSFLTSCHVIHVGPKTTLQEPLLWGIVSKDKHTLYCFGSSSPNTLWKVLDIIRTIGTHVNSLNLIKPC